MGGRLLLFGHHPPLPRNPISTPYLEFCRLSNIVLDASAVEISSSTVGEQWEGWGGCVRWSVRAVDGLRVCYYETEGKQWCLHSARQDPE